MKKNKNRKSFDALVSKTKIYLIIIAILLLTICIYESKMIVLSVVLFSSISVYSYWTNNKKREEILEHIKDITISVDSVAKNTLINSPFPMIIINEDGDIIWKSTQYVSEFANIDIKTYLKENIEEMKKEIQNTKKDKNKGDISREVKIGENTYSVIGKYVKSRNKEKQNKYMFTLYFINETDNKKMIQKYNDSKLCVGMIMIDNYEELMQRISNEDKPQIMAQIEKSIYDWTTKFEGMVIKTERDVFVCIFEQRYLEKIEESKFNILDTVKEIKIPGIIQSTLSIAISNEGEYNYMKYKSALATMDIALGRGGDQAIVRKDGKYIFYGGKSQELEKRTRVKARIVAHALEELISQSENVMIMGHINGDIDSMGSSLGIYRIAKTMGKEAYIVNATYGLTLQSLIQSLNQEEEYKDVIINKNEALSKISKNTVLIVVDTHKTGFVEEPDLLFKTNKIVVIDHHRRGEDYISNATLTFHEVYASSTAELVTELIEYSNIEVELSKLEAEALYAGIMTDTKNFTFKTGVRTFEAAAYLRKSGIDIIKVKKWFQSDLKTYNQISEIVSKAEIYKDTIAIALNEKEERDANLICAKSADELLTISDITASFVIGKMENKVYISGRSIGEINVQVILEKLGGGGHITLAGAQVEGKSLEEVKKELVSKINEYFEELS